jgi:hypothetical protein
VLQAYADDSGNNRESPVFVLAGFIANAALDWPQFEREWAAALAKAPALTYFKMNECHALQGQFLGWKRDERDKRLAELVSIIKAHVKAAIFAIVPRDEFVAAMPKSKLRFFRTPYALAYYTLISTTLKSLQSLGIKEAVDFIFDEQLRLSDDVHAQWGEITQAIARSKLAPHLGSDPMHRNDKTCLPLQAADLLAWHIRRWHDADAKGQAFESDALTELRRIPRWGSVNSKASIEAMIAEGRMRQRIMHELSREGRTGKTILASLAK